MTASATYYRARSRQAFAIGAAAAFLTVALLAHTFVFALSGNSWGWASAFPSPAALIAAVLEFRESARCRRIHLTRYPVTPKP